MFCSTIIPTIGRSDLERAVTSVLEQDYPERLFEIIVVNDSGWPLPPAAWQEQPNVTILNTNRRERSVARNAGAAVAQGKYLHFLDDDDWLQPEALQHVAALAQESGAAWLYGMTQLVDRQGAPLIVLDHRLAGNCFALVMAGEWIPLQSSWIAAAAFRASGGFNPNLTGPEDIDLARRVALTEDFAPLDQIVACVSMGAAGSSTPWNDHSRQSRAARELILDDPRTYPRLRTSAPAPYWRGRITRAYVTSALWNLQHRRPLRAASRLGKAMRSALASGRDLFNRAYWQALARPYESFAFTAGKEARMS